MQNNRALKEGEQQKDDDDEQLINEMLLRSFRFVLILADADY